MTKRRTPARKGNRAPVELEFSGYRFTASPEGTTVHRGSVDLATTEDWGADPLGDGTFRMVPSGDVVSFEERNLRLARFHKNGRGSAALSRNLADERHARKLRENFRDEPATEILDLGWTWPKTMRQVGVCESVMYVSDKWHDKGDFEDYKHVAESSQQLYARPGKLVDLGSSKKRKESGPTVEISGMPDTIAILAKFLGVQCRFFDAKGKLTPDYYQIDIKQAELGGGRHRDTGEIFLVVYTRADGPLLIVTGNALGIEKDGIVG